MFRSGSPARYVFVCAALVGLSVSSTHTAAISSVVPALVAVPITGFGAATAIAAGDFNGDGNLDLAGVTGAAANGVRVALGDGLGGFGAAASLHSGPKPVDLAVADMNADGLLDLVVTNLNGWAAGGSLVTMPGDGLGGFGAPIGLPFDGVRAIAVGHFNGDTVPDVAALVGFDLKIFLNDGSGLMSASYSVAVASNVGHASPAPVRLDTGDLNDDGLTDVAVVINNGSPFLTGNVLSTFLGLGNGTLGTRTNYTGTKDINPAYYFQVATNFESVQIADVNGDGHNDMVLAAFGHNYYGTTNGVWVMLNNTAGAFPLAAKYAGSIGMMSVAVGDMNDDGEADVAAASAYGYQVSQYFNDGTGVLGTPTIFPGSAQYGQTILGDFNRSGNGTLDMVVVRYGIDPVIFVNGTPQAASCAAGTYSESGTEPCASADLGFFVPTEGATSQSACTVGSYSSMTGATECTLAPAGSYVDTMAATGPLTCDAGSFSATEGASSCTLATPGFYVPLIGQTFQTACATGYGSDAGAIACYALDNDGDGVNNDDDSYPNSNMSATVSIGACATTVANQVLPNGATFNDLLATAATGATNHGKLVSAVTQLSNGWKNAGLISGRDHGAITSCVARSK